jgi:ribose transport system substrate-binding protein
MAISFAACANNAANTSESATVSAGTSESAAVSDTTAKKTVYVLTPAPDHGFTGQVGSYAAEMVQQIIDEGKYNAYHYTASDGSTQNDQVDEILANGDAAGVVFFAQDDSAAAGEEALTEAAIPWLSFDRIIESTQKDSVLAYSGNNWYVGAACAYYLVKNGMTPESTLVQFTGDTSSACKYRTEGIQNFLLGTQEYYDSENDVTYKITDVASAAWTQEQVDQLFKGNSYFEYECGWSNDNAKQYIEANLTSWVESAKVSGGMYVFSMDDEMSMAFLESLDGSTFSDTVKSDLAALNVYMTAVGGMEEFYTVMRGDDAALSPVADQYFDGLMSADFNPNMIKSAIQYMLDYLDGNWTFKNGDTAYENTFIVDKTNADKYTGFLGR